MNELLRRLLFLPPQGSTFAQSIDWLHFVVISATMAGATGVAILTLWYMFRYRRRGVDVPTPHIETTLAREAVLIVALLVLFLGFWVVGFRQYVTLQEPPPNAMEIYVTAKQWMWKFAYPGGRRAINVLTVPAGRPVKVVMISRDVIHSFYVPAFRIKQDVLPGRYTTAWFEATQPGTYDIRCAEYCGLQHSDMHATVVVLSQSDYDAWLANGEGDSNLEAEDFESPSGDPALAGSSLPALGRDVAAKKQCFACHTIDGQRHVGPTWRGLFLSTVPLEGGGSIVADEAYLTRSMMDPRADVHAGFKPVMPSYQGALQSSEVAAIVEFIKSIRYGDVEPSVTLPAVEPEATTSPASASSSEPVPSSSEPVPSSSKPVPSSSKPVPSSSKPVPSSSKPVPSSSKPVPSSSEPVPSP